jgi:hypothetical protein
MTGSPGNAVPSWQDVYKTGTTPRSDSLSSIAFRELLNKSAAPIGSSVPKNKQVSKLPTYSAPSDGNGHGFFEDAKNNIGKAVQTPVIKQIIDALSVGMYSTANAGDDVLGGVDKIGKGDLSGILDIAASPVTGLGKGLSAAVGNEDNVKTWSDVIKHGQKDLGMETEGGVNGAVQGWGGLAADILLDPTTYLTLGTGAVAKGLIRGAVEGGKGAAIKAAKGVEDAAKIGETVSPAVQRVVDATENGGGILNRFRNAGVDAKGNYAEWRKANGGKIATMSFPFKKSGNPKDAQGIASTNMAADKEAQLASLIPAEAAAVGVPTKVPKPVIPTKAPEVVAEEKNIVDGLTEASKPAGAPITNEATKAAKVADDPKKLLADAEHENMASILKDVKFSKPAYNGNTLNAHKLLEDAAQPTTVEKAVDNSVDTGIPDHKGTMSALKAYPGRFVKFGLKSPNKDEVVKNYIAASKSANPGQAMQQFWSQLPADLKQTVKETTPSKVVEEVPGIPIDYSHPSISGIKPEHHGMPTEELNSLRASTGNMQHMKQYVNHSATEAELSLMREKLGLTDSASTGAINRAFEEKYKVYKDRNDKALAEATAAEKAGPATPREAVGEANQATAHLAEKVSTEQTIIRRANRAIIANHEMSFPFHGVKDQSLLNYGDIEKLPQNAMNEALQFQAGKGKNPKDIRMDGGALSDTANPKTGTAVYQDKWGTLSATAIHGSVVNGVVDIAKQYLEKTGKLLPVVTKMDIYKRAVKATMANLRAMGVAPYLDLGRGNAKYGINLGLDDLTDILFKDMETHFFAGPAKRIQPQAFTTGIEALIRAKQAGKTVEETSAEIMHALTGDKAIYRGKYKDAEGIIRGLDMDSTIRDIRGAQGMTGAIAAAIKKGATPAAAKAAYLGDLKNMADKWAKDDNLYQNLNNRMIVNAKEHGAELGAMVDHVSEETLAKIVAAGNSPISTGDFMAEMAKAVKDGKAALGAEDSVKYTLWDNAVQIDRDSILKGGEQKALKTAETVSAKAREVPTPKVAEEVAVANTKNVDATVEEAKAVQAEDAAVTGMTPDMYDVHGGAISIDTMRRIHPVSSFFSTKFGLDASGLARDIGSGLHTQVRMQSIFHGGVMNYLARNPEKLMQDWKTIQNEGLVHTKAGNAAASFLPSTASAQELYKMVNSIFDVSKDNIITRNGLGARHWNAMAEAKGLKLTMDESKSMLENSRAWLSHEGLKEPKDVLEFLSKTHAVAMNLNNDIAIASSFARTFGSSVPKEGHAVLNWSKRGVTRNKTSAAGERAYGFYDLLPKTVHYSKEASRDIANIHRLLNEARSIKPEGPIGSFMNNVFNPITNLMKASQTIVRPGHWVNNSLGDVMRNYLAGVNTIAPYRHSIAMMKANGREMKAFGENPLEAYAWHKATTEGNFEVHGRGNGVVIHIGGKPQKVSYESLYRLMQDGPIMPKHHGGGVAEDFMQSANPEALNRFGQSLNDFQNKVLDNDVFSLNNLAATRDNFSRTALAIDHAMKGKFKDIHELKAAMEEQVLKWVPTSTDFTAREAKYVRPAFMYYTWLRGVTPRIVDTMMNKPGVAIAPSKALYEFAKANGVDPMSLGDPFPPNAQMPSYYHDNVIGPLMKGEGQSLWGINFANPVTDVMDQLGAGVSVGGLMDGSSEARMGKTLLSAASPFAKVPIDLATQTSNGVPIKDNFQYVQDAVGGSYGGLLSKMTGKLLNGQGRTDTANGPAHGVDQSDVAALQIANFLSGLKITDYNSPAAQRSYVGELRANQSTAKADYRRNI